MEFLVGIYNLIFNIQVNLLLINLQLYRKSAYVIAYSGRYPVAEGRLKEAGEKTNLPEENSAKPALSDLLVRLRLRSVQ